MHDEEHKSDPELDSYQFVTTPLEKWLLVLIPIFCAIFLAATILAGKRQLDHILKNPNPDQFCLVIIHGVNSKTVEAAEQRTVFDCKDFKQIF